MIDPKLIEKSIVKIKIDSSKVYLILCIGIRIGIRIL